MGASVGTVMNIQVQEKQRISCLGSFLNYKFFHRPLVQWCYNNCLVTNYVLYCLNVIVYIKHENVWHQTLPWPSKRQCWNRDVLKCTMLAVLVGLQTIPLNYAQAFIADSAGRYYNLPLQAVLSLTVLTTDSLMPHWLLCHTLFSLKGTYADRRGKTLSHHSCMHCNGLVT
jgi:hypothetical protein